MKLNYNSDEAHKVFKETVKNLPDNVDVYLVGGALRNALIRKFHGIELIQRDYDQVITAGSKIYTDYLGSLGFEERPYPRDKQHEQVAYCKALNYQAANGDSYVNWLVFDLHTVDGTTIEGNIKHSVGFTINGCAVNLRDIFSEPPEGAVMQILPTALQDIKDKRLRLNPDGYKYMPSNFYAMLRFIHAGFTAPSPEEIQLLLKELPRLEHVRFERNIQKVWSYVGGEDNARKLVKDLGIEIDVFDEQIVKALRVD